MIQGLVVALLAVAASGPVDSVAKAKGDDLGRLQGRWEAKAGKRVEFRVALEIEGNQVTATIVPKFGPELKATGEVRVDEAASPRALDWVNFATLDGQDVPKMLAIYRVDGDKLVLRNGGFNDSRPGSFEGANEGLWTQTVEFRRVPAPDKASAAAPEANPAKRVVSRP